MHSCAIVKNDVQSYNAPLNNRRVIDCLQATAQAGVGVTSSVPTGAGGEDEAVAGVVADIVGSIFGQCE